jgi:hypothetical protein
MYEYQIKDAKLGHLAQACNEMSSEGWDLLQAVPRAGRHQGETEDFVLIFRRPRPV